MMARVLILVDDDGVLQFFPVGPGEELKTAMDQIQALVASGFAAERAFLADELPKQQVRAWLAEGERKLHESLARDHEQRERAEYARLKAKFG